MRRFTECRYGVQWVDPEWGDQPYIAPADKGMRRQCCYCDRPPGGAVVVLQDEVAWEQEFLAICGPCLREMADDVEAAPGATTVEVPDAD